MIQQKQSNQKCAVQNNTVMKILRKNQLNFLVHLIVF